MANTIMKLKKYCTLYTNPCPIQSRHLDWYTFEIGAKDVLWSVRGSYQTI